MGYFCNELYSQELSKMAQSGHTGSMLQFREHKVSTMTQIQQFYVNQKRPQSGMTA